ELEARLERLRREAARYQRLVMRNAAAETIYEEKATQVGEYEARVSAQKDRIDDLSLTAPMDGVVLRRDGEVGEMAGAGADATLLWVGQPRPLRIVSEVNEEDVMGVRPGQRALLRHDGHDGPLEAVVTRITPKGDPDTKTFRVYLDLPEETPLLIGMSVEANIVRREALDVVLAPADAIENGVVQVLERGRAARRAVTTGVRGVRLVEIRSGLEPGATVLSPFRPDLRDGAAVSPAPAAETGAEGGA
ncbi:MAG: efflux RND transporter periplasmic adaptor subunit, partial [Pseudomonadota bacterium]